MKLIQKLGILKGSLVLNASSEDTLEITHKSIFTKSTNTYLLDNIDPRFTTYKGFSMQATIIAFIALLVSLISIWYGMTFLEPPADGGPFFLAFIMSLLAIGSGIKAFRSRVNVISFNSTQGNRIFVIPANKPSENEVLDFCNFLCERINKIRYNGDISKERLNEIIKRHIDFLHEQKIIDEAEMNSFKKRADNKISLTVVSMVSKNL
jgi:hypothetical protein